MAGKGGGAWKVAYADFVTAMMAFFMVMWLTSQSPKMKEALAEHFRDPPGVFDFDQTHTGHSGRKKGQRTDSPTPSFTTPPVDLDAQPKSSIPRLLLKRDHDEQHVGTILVFAHGAAELDETANSQLRELALVAAGKTQKIEIRGHASRRPLPAESPYRDAWQLSYARCVTAMEFLREQGIAANRLRLSQAGSGEPFSVLPSSATESHDGRVEVFLLAEFADDGSRFDAAPATAEKSHSHEAEAEHGLEAEPAQGEKAEAEHAPAQDVKPKPAHDEHQSAHE